jgi:hypothetical protein
MDINMDIIDIIPAALLMRTTYIENGWETSLKIDLGSYPSNSNFLIRAENFKPSGV